MKDTLDTFAPYAPLLQTFIWLTLGGVGIYVFQQQIKGFFDTIRTRIERGSGLKAGPLEIGQDLRVLEDIEKRLIVTSEQAQNGSHDRTIDEWNILRHGIYQQNREVFLVHIVRPLRPIMEEYDVYVYLVRHDSQDFTDIEHAEFFFGKHWGNMVLWKPQKEREENDLIGVATSASGPFLCMCRVTFQDGKKVDLYRYVDFEMARVFDLD